VLYPNRFVPSRFESAGRRTILAFSNFVWRHAARIAAVTTGPSARCTLPGEARWFIRETQKGTRAKPRGPAKTTLARDPLRIA